MDEFKPYYVKLRGTGGNHSQKDAQAIRVFGGDELFRGVDVYIGTKQGAVGLIVWAEEDEIVRARLFTTKHRWPPKSGPEKGRRAIVKEVFRVGNFEDPIPTTGQGEMFEKEPTPCKGCGAKILWAETVKGKAQPLDWEPESRIVLVDGRAQVVKTYTPHHSTCPDVEKFRR